MFRRKPSGVGVALHANQLEIAYVPGGSLDAIDQLRIKHVPFQKEVYENGRVNDISSFAAHLSRVFDEFGLPRQHVTLTLPSSVTVLRPIMVPKIKKT